MITSVLLENFRLAMDADFDFIFVYDRNIQFMMFR